MISYKEKRKQFSPEAQARISAGAQEIRNELRILRAIREASGLSQEELADRLEVGQYYISRLERRDNITPATLAGITQALGGSIEIAINLPGSALDVGG
jgi:ribosome-binding protein aMBF1 (putative translation factor)